MVSEKKIHIIPRKGEYCLLDKSVGSHVSHTVFALPGKIWQRCSGYAYCSWKSADWSELQQDIEIKKEQIQQEMGWIRYLSNPPTSVRNIPTRQVITSFAGLRAHEDGDDFIIGETEKIL